MDIVNDIDYNDLLKIIESNKKIKQLHEKNTKDYNTYIKSLKYFFAKHGLIKPLDYLEVIFWHCEINNVEFDDLETFFTIYIERDIIVNCSVWLTNNISLNLKHLRGN